jgi:MFS family permease
LAVIIIAHALLGAGSALFQSPANVAIMEATDKHEFGISSGIMALSRNFGTMIGIGFAVTIFDIVKSFYIKDNIAYSLSFIKSYHVTLYFGVLIAIVCAIISFFGFKKNKQKYFGF